MGANLNNHQNRSRLITCAVCLCMTIAIAEAAEGQSEVSHATPMMFPPAYVAVTSGPSAINPYITLLDATGDTDVRAQPLTTPAPLAFTLDPSGSYGEVLQTDSSLSFFPSNLNLLPGSPGVNTLPDPLCTANITASSNELLALDYKTNFINIGLSAGSSPGEYSIAGGDPVGTTPVGTSSEGAFGRFVVISQGIPYGVACNNIPHQVNQAGNATIFESSSFTTDGVGNLPLGKCPVFATTSSDGRRTFVLNRGDDSVTVINMISAQLDQQVPMIPLPITSGSHAGPVYAEYVPRLGKLLVANYENDTISVINAQLSSLGDDGPAFGQVVATIDLWDGASHTSGKHPASIAAVPDGSRAYVADQESGEVSIVDLHLNRVVGTLDSSQGLTGHPRNVAVIANSNTNSIFARAFVATPDTGSVPYIYVGDNVLHIPNCPNTSGDCAFSGNVVDIRTTAQNASVGGNSIVSSRAPGAGQPCLSANFSPQNLSDCRSH